MKKQVFIVLDNVSNYMVFFEASVSNIFIPLCVCKYLFHVI